MTIEDMLIGEAASNWQYNGIAEKIEKMEGDFRCPDCTCVHLHE